jgi:hypothetical protein
MMPLPHIKGFGSYHGLKHMEDVMEKMSPCQIEVIEAQTLNHKRVTVDADIFV